MLMKMKAVRAKLGEIRVNKPRSKLLKIRKLSSPSSAERHGCKKMLKMKDEPTICMKTGSAMDKLSGGQPRFLTSNAQCRPQGCGHRRAVLQAEALHPEINKSGTHS
jgi:hypothetical protein